MLVIKTWSEDGMITMLSSPTDNASSIARLMVAELGMSDLGPTVFQPRPQAGTLQMMMAEQNPVSQELAGKIDKEIAKIIEPNYHKRI